MNLKNRIKEGSLRPRSTPILLIEED
jgi:hypothetical protein